MNPISLGDLAQSFSLQRKSVALRNDINRLTDELASGQVSDIREVLAGNHSYLTSIERSMRVLDGYSVTNTEAGHLTESMQSALERAQDIGGSLALDLIAAGLGPVGATAGDPAQNASLQLSAIVSNLNSDIAGRSLFAGTATDALPLASAETMLSELRSVLAGQTTAEGLMTAAKVWFDDPLGFDALIYEGSATAMASFQLSETEAVTLDIKANHPALKDLLMNTAVAALATDAGFGLDVPEQTKLFRETGIALQSGQDKLTALRARIGFTQERIETIDIRNQVERTGMEFALGNLLQADPFETATELESVQFQLQSLYAVTVRSSQLSLVNFL